MGRLDGRVSWVGMGAYFLAAGRAREGTRNSVKRNADVS